MSTPGTTPDSGPGTHGKAPADPRTSTDTEPDADMPPTEPSPDASEVAEEDQAGPPAGDVAAAD